ncbi:MAG: hypothetical protein GY796_14505, partial [Chloroflexi bacterium]|nr:hypothetical protein [Chloroflexota bacterium]
ALSIIQDLHAVALALETVVGFAWLYLNKALPTRAGELVGLAQHHPNYGTDVQERLDELMPQLEATLSAAELQAALERGQAFDLDAVVVALLAEFGEETS